MAVKSSAKSVYLVCGLLLTSCLLISFASLDFSEPAMRQRVRIASRIALAFFILAFLARPLAKVWQHNVSKFLLRNRRHLGICAAISQTVFILLVAWTYSNIPRPLDEILTLREMIIGYSGMATYWILALTSNNKSMKLLGRNWHLLHTLGLYYLWYIYINSYAPGVLGNPVYIIPLSFLVGGFALRMYLLLYERKQYFSWKRSLVVGALSAVVCTWISLVIYTGQSI
ncbi:MAG: hypothetical protein MPJ50_11700 [Pirellulales bacterium]|nr:hypothetical protein [Pirellulales bacterium]